MSVPSVALSGTTGTNVAMGEPVGRVNLLPKLRNRKNPRLQEIERVGQCQCYAVA